MHKTFKRTVSHRLKALQEALEEKLFPACIRAGKGEVARKGNTG